MRREGERRKGCVCVCDTHMKLTIGVVLLFAGWGLLAPGVLYRIVAAPKTLESISPASPADVLGGSWVVMRGVISMVSRLIIRGTLLEPPGILSLIALSGFTVRTLRIPSPVIGP